MWMAANRNIHEILITREKKIVIEKDFQYVKVLFVVVVINKVNCSVNTLTQVILDLRPNPLKN